MKFDIPIIILVVIAIAGALVWQPWVENEYPEREEVLKFVQRVGDAMTDFKGAKGFYPRADTSRNYARYLLGGVESRAFLNLRAEKKLKHMRAPKGEDVETSLKLEIIDQLGNKLVYKYPVGDDSFILYSAGLNGIDDGGIGDDIVYNSTREIAPKEKEIAAFVRKAGGALEAFKKAYEYLPKSGGPTTFARYIVGGWHFDGFLKLTPEEKKKCVKVAKGDDFEKSNSPDILDPFGNPLVYSRVSFKGPFGLHSCGPDGYDDHGAFDDISYFPPHFDDSYWKADQRKAWTILCIIGALVLARIVWLAVKSSKKSNDDETKD